MAESMMFSTQVPTYYRPARDANEHCRDIADFLRINPDAWTQGVSARGGNGYPMSSMNPFARRFCTLGLLERFITSDLTRYCALGLLSKALTSIKGNFMPIHHYNDGDGRRVEDIIALFDTAAKLPSSLPLDPDDYSKLADAYYAKNSAVKALAPMWATGSKWYLKFNAHANSLLNAVDPIEAQAVADANAALAAKLVPWETIKRQIGESVVA